MTQNQGLTGEFEEIQKGIETITITINRRTKTKNEALARLDASQTLIVAKQRQLGEEQIQKQEAQQQLVAAQIQMEDAKRRINETQSQLIAEQRQMEKAQEHIRKLEQRLDNEIKKIICHTHILRKQHRNQKKPD